MAVFAIPRRSALTWRALRSRAGPLLLSAALFIAPSAVFAAEGPELSAAKPLLEFRLVDETHDAEALLAHGAAVPAGFDVLYKASATPGEKPEALVVERRVLLDSRRIVSAVVEAAKHVESNDIMLTFDEEGQAELAALSAANLGRRLAIVNGGRILSAPTIASKIEDGRAVIVGRFTLEEAEALAAALNRGRP